MAIRELPGGFRQLMAQLAHDQPELIWWRPERSAWSAVEHVAHITCVLHVLANRLVRMFAREGAELFDLCIEAPMAGSHHANVDAVLGRRGRRSRSA